MPPSSIPLPLGLSARRLLALGFAAMLAAGPLVACRSNVNGIPASPDAAPVGPSRASDAANPPGTGGAPASTAGGTGGTSPAPAPPVVAPPTGDGGVSPVPPSDGGPASPTPPSDASPGSPEDGSLAPGGCTTGQVHCSAKIPQICGADGKWLNAPACSYACDEAAKGCVNRFSAVSAGRGSPTNEDGVSEFARNANTFYSERGGLFGARGFNVAVLDPTTGAMTEPVKNFDNWTSRLTGTALSAMAEYLDALEPGRLVMIASCDDAGITPVDSCDKLDGPAAQRLLATLERLGSRDIRGYCYRGAWSLVTRVPERAGTATALAEKVSTGAKVTAEALLPAEP